MTQSNEDQLIAMLDRMMADAQANIDAQRAEFGHDELFDAMLAFFNVNDYAKAGEMTAMLEHEYGAFWAEDALDCWAMAKGHDLPQSEAYLQARHLLERVRAAYRGARKPTEGSCDVPNCLVPAKWRLDVGAGFNVCQPHMSKLFEA